MKKENYAWVSILLINNEYAPTTSNKEAEKQYHFWVIEADADPLF